MFFFKSKFKWKAFSTTYLLPSYSEVSFAIAIRVQSLYACCPDVATKNIVFILVHFQTAWKMGSILIFYEHYTFKQFCELFLN